jgi:SAM-dependent methyltransferase
MVMMLGAWRQHGLAMLLVVLSGWIGVAVAQAPHTHEHGFHGAAEWARVFDDPKRDGWQKPHEVIEALRLAPDAAVADIGAGTGYFSTRIARMLPGGKVYAVDLEPDMVRHLRERAKREGLARMLAVQASAADASLPERVDLVVFVDVYHHVGDRENYLRRLRERLRPGGRIAVIDFKLDAPLGPPSSARIAPERVRREFEQAGYALREELDFLPYQYFLVFGVAK